MAAGTPNSAKKKQMRQQSEGEADWEMSNAKPKKRRQTNTPVHPRNSSDKPTPNSHAHDQASRGALNAQQGLMRNAWHLDAQSAVSPTRSLGNDWPTLGNPPSTRSTTGDAVDQIKHSTGSMLDFVIKKPGPKHRKVSSSTRGILAEARSANRVTDTRTHRGIQHNGEEALLEQSEIDKAIQLSLRGGEGTPNKLPLPSQVPVIPHAPTLAPLGITVHSEKVPFCKIPAMMLIVRFPSRVIRTGLEYSISTEGKSLILVWNKGVDSNQDEDILMVDADSKPQIYVPKAGQENMGRVKIPAGFEPILTGTSEKIKRCDTGSGFSRNKWLIGVTRERGENESEPSVVVRLALRLKEEICKEAAKIQNMAIGLESPCQNSKISSTSPAFVQPVTTDKYVTMMDKRSTVTENRYLNGDIKAVPMARVTRIRKPPISTSELSNRQPLHNLKSYNRQLAPSNNLSMLASDSCAFNSQRYEAEGSGRMKYVDAAQENGTVFSRSNNSNLVFADQGQRRIRNVSGPPEGIHLLSGATGHDELPAIHSVSDSRAKKSKMRCAKFARPSPEYPSHIEDTLKDSYTILSDDDVAIIEPTTAQKALFITPTRKVSGTSGPNAVTDGTSRPSSQQQKGVVPAMEEQQQQPQGNSKDKGKQSNKILEQKRGKKTVLLSRRRVYRETEPLGDGEDVYKFLESD